MLRQGTIRRTPKHPIAGTQMYVVRMEPTRSHGVEKPWLETVVNTEERQTRIFRACLMRGSSDTRIPHRKQGKPTVGLNVTPAREVRHFLKINHFDEVETGSNLPS
jgi:hypothetical protein